MMRNLSGMLVALLATGACYGQAPFAAYPLNPAAYSARTASFKTNPLAHVGYGAEVGGGCATCGDGQAGYGGTPGGCGCGGGQVGQPGFVGGCCDYLKPRARGLWNSYCGDRHVHGGCGCGFGGTPTPIGMYGATPFGCCAAGVNCGCGCGVGHGLKHGLGCGAGCGTSCGTSCGTGCNNCFGWFSSRGGCGCGVTKPCGWRMGLGGYPCSTSDVGCTTGCSSGATHSSTPNVEPTPAALPEESVPAPPPDDEIAPPLPMKAALKSKSPGWLSGKSKAASSR